MRNFAPLTKLILTFFFTVWAFLVQPVAILTVMPAGIVLLIVLARPGNKVYKSLFGIFLAAVFVVAIQCLLGVDAYTSIAAGLRMLIMAYSFIILLSTTRIQDLTTALVRQCRIPYEYAFMFTAALRFVPDLLAESKAVQQAQSCRGYSSRGSIVKRMLSYLTVVQPLVLRSVSRSETMAMALELRGFGGPAGRSFVANVKLGIKDYALLAGIVLITAELIAFRFSG